MDFEFKAFIAAILATPLSFAAVSLIEKIGGFTFTKYGAWQLITFLIGLSYASAHHYFSKQKRRLDTTEQRTDTTAEAPSAMDAKENGGNSADDGGAPAAGIGAVASGGSTVGAATAFNADVNNRQIGAQERILARSLADQAKETGLKKPDGSAYTQADIENAMRNSGRGNQPITQGMLVDPKGITDKGAAFTAGSDGKTLVQVNQDGSNLNQNTIDLKLAAYIVERTGGTNTPYRDLYNRVEAAKSGPPSNPNAGLNTVRPNASGAVTAEAAAGLLPMRNPVRDINDIRNDVADGAAVVGRGSDITAATSTMAAAVPGPHQPGAATTALVATGVGLAANVVEQVARPDVGKGLNDFMGSVLQEQLDRKLPIMAPVTNESIEHWKKSGSSESFEKWINREWGVFLKSKGAQQ
jgi:hypothetical protein